MIRKYTLWEVRDFIKSVHSVKFCLSVLPYWAATRIAFFVHDHQTLDPWRSLELPEILPSLLKVAIRQWVVQEIHVPYRQSIFDCSMFGLALTKNWQICISQDAGVPRGGFISNTTKKMDGGNSLSLNTRGSLLTLLLRSDLSFSFGL